MRLGQALSGFRIKQGVGSRPPETAQIVVRCMFHDFGKRRISLRQIVRAVGNVRRISRRVVVQPAVQEQISDVRRCLQCVQVSLKHGNRLRIIFQLFVHRGHFPIYIGLILIQRKSFLKLKNGFFVLFFRP